MATVGVVQKIKKGGGKKNKKDLLDAMPPAPSNPLPPLTTEKMKIQKSKLEAANHEILSLQADNLMLQQDVDDKTEKLNKLNEKLQNQSELVSTFKTEAQTLKMTVLSDTTKHDKLKEEHKNTLKELKAVKGRFEEMAAVVGEAKALKDTHETTFNTMETNHNAKVADMQRENAKELGRLKNLYEDKLQTLHKQCATTERECEQKVRQLKETMVKTESELKDTAVSLANRCNAYEKRIDVQAQEIQQLQMKLQLKITPNSYKNKQTEQTINELKFITNKQNKQITAMMEKLNMHNLNKHFDFRDSHFT